MKLITSLVILCLAAVAILSGCKDSAPHKPAWATPDSIMKTAEKGPVKMTVRIVPKEPRLSDLVDLDITVEAEAGVEIQPPPFGKGVGDFLVRDFGEEHAPPAENKVSRHFRYQLEPVHRGRHLIRSIAVEFTDKRPGSASPAEPTLVETEPIEVNVQSELGETTPNLADLSPMVQPLPLPPSPLWLWLLGALGVCAAAVGGILVARRYRKHVEEQAKPPTPEELAHQAMRALLSENLHGKGEFKEFYVRLTGIVRRYIEATTGVRAPEETTEEFLRDVRQRQVFPHDRAVNLGRFLEAADLVKYAAQKPGERQIEEAISRAQEFVGLPSAFMREAE
jgi:hypothetical protein